MDKLRNYVMSGDNKVILVPLVFDSMIRIALPLWRKPSVSTYYFFLINSAYYDIHILYLQL